MAFLNAYLDVRQLLDALRESGTLPQNVLPLLEEAAALCEGAKARVNVATILPLLVPPPSRRDQSGCYAIDTINASDGAVRAAGESVLRAHVPHLVRVDTPTGQVGFAVPDHDELEWRRLRYVIETATVERLLRANGRPLGLDQLPELRDADRSPSEIVGNINTQIAGGRSHRLVETCGAPPRKRGQRRKVNPAEEPADHRLFLIHTSWHVERATLLSLRDIEEKDEDRSELVRLFGKPARTRE